MKTLLVAVAVLLVAGVLALQITVVQVGRELNSAPPVPPPRYDAVSLPQLEVLTAPHAILVLDVSNSMHKSDAEHLQTEAVLRFWEVYRDLSREIAGRGDTARIAVVLFSTVAQVVDWGGDESVWLTVTAANDDRFGGVVTAYLGRAGGAEPRRGRDTDHVAALHEVVRLTEDLGSPPLVVFMTDGRFEPHPLFSPVVDAAERARLFPEQTARLSAEIEKVRRGELRLLPASGGTPIFDTALVGGRGALNLRLPAGEESRLVAQVARARAEALEPRFTLTDAGPPVCLSWFPLFLIGRGAAADAIDMSAVLSSGGNCGPWPEVRAEEVVCRDATELAPRFVRALSGWFRLQERRIHAGMDSLQVPAQTLAFAAYLETKTPASRVVLESHRGSVALQGRGTQWAGVVQGDGLWRVSSDGGGVVAGQIYLRPTHDWVLHCPSRVTLSSAGGNVEVELHLFSLLDRKAVDAPGIFRHLPAELSARAQVPGEGAERTLVLRRDGCSGGPAPAAFCATLHLERLPEGPIRVEVDLAPMAAYDVPTNTGRLVSVVEVRPHVVLRVRDEAGREVGVHVEGIPREGEGLRRFWEGAGGPPSI